jgi:hypothetical protein
MRKVPKVYEITKIDGLTMRQFRDGMVKIDVRRELLNWLLLAASMGLEQDETRELHVIAELLTNLTGYKKTWLDPRDAVRTENLP